jgi:hypothetical protein
MSVQTVPQRTHTHCDFPRRCPTEKVAKSDRMKFFAKPGEGKNDKPAGAAAARSSKYVRGVLIHVVQSAWQLNLVNISRCVLTIVVILCPQVLKKCRQRRRCAGQTGI